jgi:hypothetical protein
MNILCKLFGHRPEFGYGRAAGDGYFKVDPTYCALDGIGRTHFRLLSNCERCGKEFQVGKVHGNKDGQIGIKNENHV